MQRSRRTVNFSLRSNTAMGSNRQAFICFARTSQSPLGSAVQEFFFSGKTRDLTPLHEVAAAAFPGFSTDEESKR